MTGPKLRTEPPHPFELDVADHHAAACLGSIPKKHLGDEVVLAPMDHFQVGFAVVDALRTARDPHIQLEEAFAAFLRRHRVHPARAEERHAPLPRVTGDHLPAIPAVGFEGEGHGTLDVQLRQRVHDLHRLYALGDDAEEQLEGVGRVLHRLGGPEVGAELAFAARLCW